MSRRLTSRQVAVIAVIRSTIAMRGYPPTLREIGAALGIKSTNGVNDHLDAIERKGYIERDRSIARGIRLTALAGCV